MKSITERAASFAAEIVKDRILAKASRPTLGGVLEGCNECDKVMILRDSAPIFVGFARNALALLDAYTKTEKVSRDPQRTDGSVYIYLSGALHRFNIEQEALPL